MEILKQMFSFILSLFITKQFAKELVLFFLRKFVAATDNKMDDDLLKKIEEALA